MSQLDVYYVVARRIPSKPKTAKKTANNANNAKNMIIPRALVAASLKPFILSILADGESYGYEIIQRVHNLTGGKVQWTTSTLYPLLHKLEGQGLLDSFWQDVGSGPDRKYYRLSRKGRKALEVEKQQWLSVHEALVTLWGPAPAFNPV